MKKYVLPLLIALTSVSAFAQKKIELKTDLQDTSPKFMLSADGKATGLCIEIMNLLEAKENFKFAYKPAFLAPKVIESNIESGAADIHCGWVKTPEREKIATFGPELYKVSYIGAVRANDKVDFKTVSDLINLDEMGKVLGVYGVASTGNLMKISGLKVDDQGKDPEANLKKLAAGQGRVFVYHNLGIGYELQQPEHKGKFKMVKIDWENNTKLNEAGQFVVYSKKLAPDTVQKVNAAITKHKTEIDAIVKKFGG